MEDPRMRRNTKQRRVILRVVEELGCHPTAERIFDEVRKVLPRTSLSTVYRNLGILSDQGEISVFTGTGKEVHYDHNTCEHCHIECSRCGRICDVDVYPIDRRDLTPNKLSGFILTGIDVSMTGICPDCAEQEEKE
jgi:Fur family transcriptional regulator, ferric uptake regulator